MSGISVRIAQSTSYREADTVILHPLGPTEIDGGLTLITGPSGSGKSTLANIVLGRIAPTTGRVEHLGANEEILYINEPLRRLTGMRRLIGGMAFMLPTESAAAEHRKRHLGFIAQAPHMPLGLTGDEYVQLVNKALCRTPDQGWIRALYDRLGITVHESKRRTELSGGEAQRFAIALALAGRPDFVVADEPTSALDSVSSVNTLELLRDIAHPSDGAKPISVLMVSHDPVAVEYADRLIVMKDGRIAHDSPVLPLTHEQVFEERSNTEGVLRSWLLS